MIQMMIKIESRITKNKAMEERRNVFPNKFEIKKISFVFLYILMNKLPYEWHESIRSNRILDRKCNMQ